MDRATATPNPKPGRNDASVTQHLPKDALILIGRPSELKALHRHS